MAETPKIAQDKRLKAFFRDALQGEPGVGGELAERMAGRCVESIDRLLSGQKENSAEGLAATAAHVAGRAKPDDAKARPAEEPQAPAFDPFAFSAVALMARNGREALIARLGTIEEAAHLRQLAEAQHIAVDAGLTDPAELRLALVRGVERRIASRRAAAS
jgi:hypothetical protein